MRFQHFRDRKIKWKELQKELVDKAGINKEVAENVPVVPVGYHDKFSVPAAKCDNWLDQLWFQILLRLNTNSLKEQDWEATMTTYLQSDGRNSLFICVIGRTGTGKSALVNNIVGNNDAEEDEIAKLRVTAKVASYMKGENSKL